MADAELAAFYREQASRMARHVLDVAHEPSRLELLEMAATFQRLAMREEGLAVADAANANTASFDEKTV